MVYDHLIRGLEPEGQEQLDADLHEPDQLDQRGELGAPEDGWSWGDPVTVDMAELDDDQQAWLRDAGVLT